jgi:hypothetical protein
VQVKIFETFQDAQGQDKLNQFLQGDGRVIAVDKIFTAATATESFARHFITVVYNTLEQAPQDVQ